MEFGFLVRTIEGLEWNLLPHFYSYLSDIPEVKATSEIIHGFYRARPCVGFVSSLAYFRSVLVTPDRRVNETSILRLHVSYLLLKVDFFRDQRKINFIIDCIKESLDPLNNVSM